MGSVMTEERLTGSITANSESSPEQQNRSAHGPEGNMDRPRLAEVRFFARLMTELFGRGPRGHGTRNSESGERVANGPLTPPVLPAGFVTEPSALSGGIPGDHTSTSTEESSAEPNPPIRPRRHTTIRFIQIGDGGRLDLAGGRRSRNRSMGSGQGPLRSDSPEDMTGMAREDLADAIIMLLSNASTAASLEGETSGTTAADGPEGSRLGRSRRSPWLVLTLSGAFLGLLAGAGQEGEESGMSYDELWALSNLIGPARPTTTTQEAIDNAGFHVGQFEDASKGMRGFHTLGDGSKCLVCMSDYEEGEDMRALSCKHGFHQECIDKWLTTGANKCPVCRAAAVVPSEPAMSGALAREE
ncbi:hypothetical protein BGX29_000084 [Mortierella sp. GBA35]|nr:hypothetical protein BGX29_000084 [Mortierella sp. GBA35]